MCWICPYLGMAQTYDIICVVVAQRTDTSEMKGASEHNVYWSFIHVSLIKYR